MHGNGNTAHALLRMAVMCRARSELVRSSRSSRVEEIDSVGGYDLKREVTSSETLGRHLSLNQGSDSAVAGVELVCVAALAIMGSLNDILVALCSLKA